jgi:hypothetical protein
MDMDSEQKEGILLSIWQAITLVGDARERSDEIASSELETVLAEAEALLIGAVSEAATRQRRGLRLGKRFTTARPITFRGADRQA